jgi:hypothetical protein
MKENSLGWEAEGMKTALELEEEEEEEEEDAGGAGDI